jgi:hypothetical protein
MREKSLILLLVTTLLLAACAGPISTPIGLVTENPVTPSAVSSAPTAYPVPVVVIPIDSSAYPKPGTPGPGNSAIPPSGYEPQPGDDKLTRGQVFLDLKNSSVVISESFPAQVSVILNGNLPDPCHKLRVVVIPANTQDEINLVVYSVADPGLMCITVIEPFSATIPLGSYSTGQGAVMVNGERLGEFGTPYDPQPGDDQLTRGEVTLDMATSQLIVTKGETTEASAVLQGDLPDNCHQLRIVFTPADAQNKINLEAYSLYDPQTICTALIQPFQVIYPLGNFPRGHYSVYVNGQLLAEFDG